MPAIAHEHTHGKLLRLSVPIPIGVIPVLSDFGFHRCDKTLGMKVQTFGDSYRLVQLVGEFYSKQRDGGVGKSEAQNQLIAHLVLRSDDHGRTLGQERVLSLHWPDEPTTGAASK